MKNLYIHVIVITYYSYIIMCSSEFCSIFLYIVLNVMFDSMTYETGEDLGIVEVRIITSGITDILLNVTITTMSGSALGI